MRTTAIWIFGLVASAIIGGLAAARLTLDDYAVLGVLAGMACFACARLWATAGR